MTDEKIHITAHWGKTYIQYAVKNGMMSGTSATTFKPNDKVTRAMVVAVLYWMSNSPAVGKNPFKDVPNGKWYTDAAIWAKEKGITVGTSSTTFSPNVSVTREQTAQMFYKYAGLQKWKTTLNTSSLNKFSDSAKVSSYARPAMQWAVTNKVMSGTDTNKLLPQDTLTRAQLATMLRLLVENTAT